MLKVGVQRTSINPPLTLPHAGWGAQTHTYPEGIDGEGLFATAIYASDGEREAVMVEYDVCLFTQVQVDRIRTAVAEATGLPGAAVRVTTTHNHAGPMIEATYYGLHPEVRTNYLEMLVHQGAGAAMRAKAAAAPARVATGSGLCHFARHRRQKLPDGRVVTGSDPNGIIDPDVKVVRIDAEDGQPLLAIFSYTAHPTTLGPPNRILSADYPGEAKRLVRELTGATAVFVQGATGNVGPGPEGYTGDLSIPHRLGRILACEVVKVYEGLQTRPVRHVFDRVVESGAPLGVFRPEPEPLADQTVDFLSVPLALPLREQPALADAQAAADAAAGHLRALKEAGAADEEVALATFKAKRTSMALDRARSFGGQTTKEVELHLLRIGPAVFAGIPNEPFVEIGLAVKAASPYACTAFGGYTNGWLGYIPMPEAYPDGGYEVDTTPYAPAAAQAVVDGTLAALRTLKQREETPMR
jgi:hypothetical protein